MPLSIEAIESLNQQIGHLQLFQMMTFKYLQLTSHYFLNRKHIAALYHATYVIMHCYAATATHLFALRISMRVGNTIIFCFVYVHCCDS